MLKPKYRKTHIVSRLFDTIHKMSHEEESENEEVNTCQELFESVGENIKYIVSVPKLPLKITRRKPTLICTYQVRTDGLYPFLLFLFKNDATFIRIDNHKQMKYAAISHMQTILPSTPLTYAGFYESEENNIIILSAEETKEIKKEYIWVTPFEIINLKKILHYHVDPTVISFFLSNPDFLILKDERNRIYESPMIGYKSHTNICTEDEMDIYRETIIQSLGKCYYIDKDIPKTSASVMRIAFFPGRIVLNREKNYDSLLCGDKYYIIQNYDQHVVLSVFRTSL